MKDVIGKRFPNSPYNRKSAQDNHKDPKNRPSQIGQSIDLTTLVDIRFLCDVCIA